MNNVSVVIYGVDEGKNFESVVVEAQACLKTCAGQYQFILVDDGSRDDTLRVLSKLLAGLPDAKIITHAKRRGIGACLKDGFQAADLDLVTFMPADGQIDPGDLARMVQAMEGVDFVTSYYESTSFPLVRRIMSKSVRWLVFVLFGPSPRIEGSYMFRRKILQNITLKSDAFTVNFEFVIKAHRQGFTCKEIPTQSRKRLSGESKVVNTKTIFNVFCEIIKLRLDR